MSADTCTVSVIVAAYNAAPFISTCLDSVARQTIGTWEVIVVDDHSTDDTAAIVRAYVARDDRFRLLTTPRNGGPSVARNIGLEASRGTWIAILDADDSYAPQRLERLLQHARSEQSDIVSDNQMVVVASDGPAASPMFKSALMQTPHRLGLEEFILGNMSKRDEPRVAFGFMKPLMKTAFLRDEQIRYDEQMRFSEDFALYITCIQRGARWDYLPEPMYLYTVHPESLSESSVRVASELRRVFEFSRDLASSEMALADPGAKRAALLYFHRVRRWYSYRFFVESLNARKWGQAMSLLYRSPDAIAGVAAEAMVQAPALARKLVNKVSRRSALAR